MPNLRGPDERRRRLYMNVAISVVLYGAPVWGDVIARSKLLPALYRLQRTIAQRVISAYRTVSSNAALLLARLPPLKFMAMSRKRVYEFTKRSREDGSYSPETLKDIKEAEALRLCNEWRELLEKPNTPGEWTKLAIVPRLEAWMARDSGSSGMSYHLTQIFTGHGCFANFLRRIGKRRDASCDFCGEEDNAFHTMRECPYWDLERIRLRNTLELSREFTLGDVVEAIVESKANWKAFSAYVEEVMKDKEEEERRREREKRLPLIPTGMTAQSEGAVTTRW
ncbi:reverse transcriptase [Lasius niger]|uniref:Reverse transcriptase n=1 Tax=Lasius niger TaxID=67767 RepID=A0A0J7KS95_LASNI|nr:reverse transcriptase [Lasius niger]